MLNVKEYTILYVMIFFKNIAKSVSESPNAPPLLSIKLIGGNEASLYEYTFIAILLKYSDKKYIAEDKGKLKCGGAIIHKSHVLTAARCFDDEKFLELFEVIGGVVDFSNMEGQQVRQIKRLAVHPSYIRTSDEYNIALIEVSFPYSITTHVGVGILPTNPLDFRGTDQCHILGFLKKETPHEGNYYRLIKVQMRPIDYSECINLSKFLKIKSPYTLSQKNYCLAVIEKKKQKQHSICEGDVGAPSICGFKIQGLIAHYTNETCEQMKYTSVVDIGHHLNWIRANILRLQLVSAAQDLVISQKFVYILTVLIVLSK